MALVRPEEGVITNRYGNPDNLGEFKPFGTEITNVWPRGGRSIYVPPPDNEQTMTNRYINPNVHGPFVPPGTVKNTTWPPSGSSLRVH